MTLVRSRRSAACLLAGVALLSVSVAAQRRIDPPDGDEPDHSEIRIGGNSLERNVTCTQGQAVYVQGQHNQVEVGGPCRFIRVQGNDNHVFERGHAPIHVEGSYNLIEVLDPDTPYSERGEHNRFERRR